MPTYEYACKSCGQHLEVVQSFKDAALTECPSCAGQLRKVFGNIGISFKGSGFYKTDSRSSTGKSSAGASGSSSETGGGGSSGSSDGSSTSSTSSSSSGSTSTSPPASTSSTGSGSGAKAS